MTMQWIFERVLKLTYKILHNLFNIYQAGVIYLQSLQRLCNHKNAKHDLRWYKNAYIVSNQNVIESWKYSNWEKKVQNTCILRKLTCSYIGMIFFFGVHTLKFKKNIAIKNMEHSEKNFASERTIEGKEGMGNDIFIRTEGK